MVSQITSLTITSSTVYSGADQRKHQSSVSMAFVQGIHRRLVNSPHTWPVTRKMFPFDDFIMSFPDVTKVFDEVSLPQYPRVTSIVNCHTNVDLWLILTCSALIANNHVLLIYVMSWVNRIINIRNPRQHKQTIWNMFQLANLKFCKITDPQDIYVADVSISQFDLICT